MKTLIHRADSRGHANHGWLDTHHTFSFASYYHPERVHFGLLRVLNDDVVEGGSGFGTHPHQNMEIVSIPLSGALEHKDSMGTNGIIRANDVQAMSAGKGITHSEYNHSAEEPVNFLQIWIFPKYKDIAPRYDQKTFEPAGRRNTFQQIVSPLESPGEGVKINQDAFMYRADMDEGLKLTYRINESSNGIYLFVLAGSVEIDGEILNKRDGMGLLDVEAIPITAKAKSELLLIEIPMHQS